MTGTAWFVQVVHYPLFAEVGSDRFPAYHEAHSRLTTRVVIVPMVVELSTALLMLFDPPAGETLLTAIGAVLAVAAWALTFLAAVPAHRELGAGLAKAPLRRLLRANLIRTWVWALHSGVCLALIAASA